MRRRAILIESARVSGEQDLPGARVDVVNWKAFLLSAPGGAWNEDEIATFSSPSVNVLSTALAREAMTDYVFVTFSGHGSHLRGKDLDETRICLSGDEEIPARALNPGNPRCTIIIDACRQLILVKALLESFAASDMLRGAALLDRRAYRALFDKAVLNGEKGPIFMYSCAVEEAAGESAQSGGYYTDGLLRCCRDWHNAEKGGASMYFPVSSAHQCAQRRTGDRNPQQHPQYEGGRRHMHFPLAVKP